MMLCKDMNWVRIAASPYKLLVPEITLLTFQNKQNIYLKKKAPVSREEHQIF